MFDSLHGGVRVRQITKDEATQMGIDPVKEFKFFVVDVKTGKILHKDNLTVDITQGAVLDAIKAKAREVVKVGSSVGLEIYRGSTQVARYWGISFD